MKQIRLLVPLIALVFMTSCSTVGPNSDPLVVRAEQSISVAFATFDTFVKLDNVNRERWKTNFPAVHAFAEYLREPVGVPPVARGISWIESTVAVKGTYKWNRTLDNKANLITALATLDTALVEVQKQLDSTK